MERKQWNRVEDGKGGGGVGDGEREGKDQSMVCGASSQRGGEGWGEGGKGVV